MKSVSIIGLFSGAGGLDLGATWAGGTVRLAVDSDPDCCATLKANRQYHPGRVEQADLTAVTGQTLRGWADVPAGEPLVVVGGPPCQPFSKAAYWTDSGADSRHRRARSRGEQSVKPKPVTEAKPDERRDLLFHYWRLVKELDAEAFVLENVPSIKHPRNVATYRRFVSQASDGGYQLLELDVNAVHYGVAQKRQRAVVIGMKGGHPPSPEPTHAETGHGGMGRLPVVTAGEALAGLDLPCYSEPEEVVKGRYEKELREIPPGQNYKALSAWAGHPNPTFEAETRFWNFLLKLRPDLPSWTIPANPGPWIGPFHWTSRRLRTVELAALQSFPRDHHFAGSRRARVRQLGNAVPPLLAQKVIEPMICLLKSGQYRSPRPAVAS